MMSTIRKRSWSNKGGTQTAWVLTYVDQEGVRRQKTFGRKGDAESWRVDALHAVKQRKHVPESTAPTVGKAAAAWIRRGEAEGRERSTLAQRREHVDRHIRPLLGDDAKLNKVDVGAFRDELLRTRSRQMARKVMTSMKAILKQAQLGHLADDAPPIEVGGRHKRRPEAGRDFPTQAEVRTLLASATGYARALLVVAVFCGLRASELRALRWQDLSFEDRRLHVRQRADKYNSVGALKSETSYRSVPMPPIVINTLKEWRLARQGELIFGNGLGNVESLPNIWNRHLAPLQRECGIVNAEGRPRYGLHGCRHFFASWRLAEGDSIVKVAALLGHSTPVVTLNQYAHLLPQDDEDDRLAKSAAALVG